MNRRQDWIAERLRQIGKTQVGLGEALGLSKARISEMKRGARGIKHSEIPRMARYLEMSEADVVALLNALPPESPMAAGLRNVPPPRSALAVAGEPPPPPFAPPPLPFAPPPLQTAVAGADRAYVGYGPGGYEPASLHAVQVRGEVEAGVWREAVEWPETEWYPISVPASKFDHLPQFALRVRGPSMDLFYPEGSVVICVPYVRLGRQPRSGERVVVERHNAGLVEATVKELAIETDGRVLLWPRSSNPRFQQPIAVPRDSFRYGLAEGPAFVAAAPGPQSEAEVEIRVTALVIGSYRWEA